MSSLLRTLLATACASFLLAPPAFAADDTFDDDEEEPAPKRPTGDGDAPPSDEDPKDDDALGSGTKPSGGGGKAIQLDDDEEDPLDGSTPEVRGQGPGEDTAKIYRETLEEVSRYAPDEEALAWERYVKKYPKSLFLKQINERIDTLSKEMYDSYIEDEVGRTGDAGKQEINFTIPMQLENIDPRTKLRAGFEWGFPNWINFIADYERQLFRELSVHGGLRNRFGGWNAELGARYALVKSARLQMLVTGIGDVRVNLNPAYPAFRPQVGVGKRFKLDSGGYIDAQLQGGSDLAFASTAEGLMFSPRLVGGANVNIAPTQRVHIFFETSSYMKELGNEQIGSFRFNQFAFGMRIVERRSKTAEKFVTSFGAAVPYTTKYWSHHRGAVMGDINYFLPSGGGGR
jgi:hypothetical protein